MPLLVPFLFKHIQTATFCQQVQLSPGFLPPICHNSKNPSSQPSLVLLEIPGVSMQQTSAVDAAKPRN